MTVSSDIERPIILFLGSTAASAEEKIGNNNEFTEQIFGITPLVLQVPLPGWVLRPEGNDLLELIKLQPDRSLNQLKEWVKTNDFNEFVRQYLGEKLKDAGKYETEFETTEVRFEAVRVIVFDKLPYPGGEGAAKALVSSVFPNAVCVVYDAGLMVDLALPTNDPIEELKLEARTVNGLTRAGIHTVSDLCKKTERELEAIPNFGEKCRRDVINALARRGLGLAADS